jgi:ABC-type sugar transport system ATPase subunit
VTAARPQPLLRMTGLQKRYGGVHALRGAELCITSPGSVHTLVGENGSGKSTLLGILAGQVRPDEGEILLDGRRVSFASPADAIAQGIAMVSQETAVAPDLTVAENILLGRRLVRGRLGVSARRTRARAIEILAHLGLDYDPAALLGHLRPDQRQMVEIARALSMDARVLILDEPTSSLTDAEVEGLFRAIREIKMRGVAVLFVSHRLDDLFTIADDVTVLRDGTTVHAAPMRDMDAASLVATMVGPAAEGRRAAGRAAPAAARTEVALAVHRLRMDETPLDVSFDVHAGEVVGLAGLSGAGRSELLEALFGVRRCQAEITLGSDSFVPASPRASIDAGLGFLPPDRKTQALILSMSISDNVNLLTTHGRGRFGRPRRERETAVAGVAASAMQVKASSYSALAGSLSGGNQQKVALGKWLTVAPRVLLLDEPTRGVDVAAKWEIQRRLRTLADDGLALLVSSSENDQLLELCDRILVLFRGRIVATLRPDETSEAELAHLTGGHA